MNYNFSQKQKKSFEYKKKLLENKTKAEKCMGNILKEMNVYFKEQKAFLNGFKTFCIVDFYLPRPLKIALEIDGKYHDNENQSLKDIKRDFLLKQRGIRTIRFKNEDVINNREYIIDAINGLIS